MLNVAIARRTALYYCLRREVLFFFLHPPLFFMFLFIPGRMFSVFSCSCPSRSHRMT